MNLARSVTVVATLTFILGAFQAISHAQAPNPQSPQQRAQQMRQLQQQSQTPNRAQRSATPGQPPATGTPVETQHRAASANTPPPQTERAPHVPFKLTPAEQQRVDQLLSYWESRSGKVKTYSCEFVRMEYDTVFGPKNPNWPKTKSEGRIRFASPDKGEFRVERIGRFQPPAKEGGEPQYPMEKDKTAEHWICNGESVFELNATKRQLIQRTLPEEMRGKQIADGPLPFMFGAKKSKLLQRYWVRELRPPANRAGEYWMEAYPKLAETAAEFQRVRIILDEKTFLPNAMEVYPPTYHAKTNPSRTVYIFQDRRVNDPLHRSQKFFGQFISPKTPLGWKKIVENFNEPAPGPSVAKNPAAQPRGQRSAKQQR